MKYIIYIIEKMCDNIADKTRRYFMGLDGISVNQLRLKQENTSKELAINTQMVANRDSSSRSVNSLDKKGAIDTDDKENTSYFGAGSTGEEGEEEKEETKKSEEFVKIDLTDKEKYEIKIDENSSSLTIYNKKSQSVVQNISANELSTLVDNLKNPSGILVNKRI